MTFAIMYNRTTDHISGLDERTKCSSDGMNYAQSACSAVTRGWLAKGAESDDLREVLRSFGKVRKACKNCQKAAELALAEIEKAEAAEAATETEEVEDMGNAQANRDATTLIALSRENKGLKALADERDQKLAALQRKHDEFVEKIAADMPECWGDTEDDVISFVQSFTNGTGYAPGHSPTCDCF
jgi:hypothetical protein